MNGENLISAFRKMSLGFRARLYGASDSDDSEDALQEAFCRLWVRRDRIEGEKAAEGMLATASRNVLIDAARRRKAHPESAVEDIGDLCEALPEEEAREIYERVDRLAAETLTPRDREILYHREKDGWDYGELAEHYGLSESNLRMIVSRARKSLRNVYNARY